MQKHFWKEEYNIGVKKIDEQHKHFFLMTNKIIEMTQRQFILVSELLSVINDLNDYANYHFLTEEELFNRYNYPEKNIHLKAHNEFREKKKQFLAEIWREKSEANTKEMAIKIAEYSARWLDNHLLNMDQRYKNFMKKNGVK